MNIGPDYSPSIMLQSDIGISLSFWQQTQNGNTVKIAPVGIRTLRLKHAMFYKLFSIHITLDKCTSGNIKLTIYSSIPIKSFSEDV